MNFIHFIYYNIFTAENRKEFTRNKIKKCLTFCNLNLYSQLTLHFHWIKKFGNHNDSQIILNFIHFIYYNIFTKEITSNKIKKCFTFCNLNFSTNHFCFRKVDDKECSIRGYWIRSRYVFRYSKSFLKKQHLSLSTPV